MPASNMFWVFAMFAVFCWAFRGRRLHRRGSDDGFGRPPQHVAKQIEVALADRDATIADLEERVRVLERIATDRKSWLNEEIDRLHA